MRKPIILKTDAVDYKFILKFSTLIKIRSEYNIDLINGTNALQDDIANLRKIFYLGVQAGEDKKIKFESFVDIFDELVECYTIPELVQVVVDGMAVKSIITEEEGNEETVSEKK
ncbi:MAG: hypothetical protein ACRC28_18740 [Clostridium sp.]|uniref:hypothetical protein n=1 Tax=Clostridium sp. TaxID=1506 RepID=UPI003F3BAC45